MKSMSDELLVEMNSNGVLTLKVTTDMVLQLAIVTPHKHGSTVVSLALGKRKDNLQGLATGQTR